MRRHFVSGFPRALLSLSQEKSSGVEIDRNLTGIRRYSVHLHFKSTAIPYQPKELHWIIASVLLMGPVRPTCCPGELQRVVYNGHKRVHALKFKWASGYVFLFLRAIGKNLKK